VCSLEIGPDIRPRAAMTDKGYDSKANRTACRQRGITPVIPHRSNARNKPKFFPKLLYKARARIEQAVGKLKRFKRVALRCEKTKVNFEAIVCFACVMVLVKFVHMA
jgi:transposase